MEKQNQTINIHPNSGCIPESITLINEKKRSERCKHCALAVVRRSQKFSPCHRPPSWGCRTAKI